MAIGIERYDQGDLTDGHDDDLISTCDACGAKAWASIDDDDDEAEELMVICRECAASMHAKLGAMLESK